MNTRRTALWLLIWLVAEIVVFAVIPGRLSLWQSGLIVLGIGALSYLLVSGMVQRRIRQHVMK